MENIPVFKPFIDDDEIKAAEIALRMGWLGMGAYVGDFEKAVEDLLGIKNKYAVALSTGHAALHLGLIIAGVGKDDEVITPSFNNVADFQAIIAVGANPVFCDIDDSTLCIDLDKAEKLVTKKTKAIIVMDYDCILCDHDKVKAFSEKFGLRVIHDAAHSFGSFYKGKAVGSFSDICMFSFDPVKTITCIDGGILIVSSEQERDMLHEMRLIGMSQPAKVMYQNKRAWTYDVSRLGFRYHMANLHAAIGLQQLKKLDIISKSRIDICKLYNDELGKLMDVKVPESKFEEIVPFLYYIRVIGSKRDELREYLSQNGIDTGIHWQPGHWFKLFKDCKKGDLSVTDKVASEILSLPLHSGMKLEDANRVIKGIRDFFNKENINA